MYSPSPLLARLLSIPGFFYGRVVRVRGRLYSLGILEKRRLSNPVISIGNITLGGSGKTPLVIHTAKLLIELGTCPALLSRGYGRANSSEVRILGPGATMPFLTNDLGDEPALIRLRVPEIWLGISADRYRAAGDLLRCNSDLTFILDDGFQHLQLERDLDVLVVDCSQPLAENRLFPGGSLREPLAGMSRAQAIVLNVSAAGASSEKLVSTMRKLNSHAPFLHCSQMIERVIPFAGWSGDRPEDSASPREGKAFLVAAIGNPERFRRDVESLGIQVRGSRFYRDHHSLSPGEWNACVEEARKCGAAFILVTEKDAMKVISPPGFPLMVAVQGLRMQEATEFRNMLVQVIGRRR